MYIKNYDKSLFNNHHSKVALKNWIIYSLSFLDKTNQINAYGEISTSDNWNKIIYSRRHHLHSLSFLDETNQISTNGEISTSDLEQNDVSKTPFTIDSIETINNKYTDWCSNSLWKHKSLKKQDFFIGYLKIKKVKSNCCSNY